MSRPSLAFGAIVLRKASALALAAVLAVPGAVRAAADELLVVAPRELGKLWKLERGSWRDAVPNEAYRDLGYGCAAVAFVVESDGRTSGARVLRDTPEGTFVAVATRIAANLRFAPTAANGTREPVYTYLTISFAAGEPGSPGSHVRQPVVVGDHEDRLCKVAGFVPAS